MIAKASVSNLQVESDFKFVIIFCLSYFNIYVQFPHVLSLKRKHLLTDREKHYKTKFINTWTLSLP